MRTFSDCEKSVQDTVAHNEVREMRNIVRLLKQRRRKPSRLATKIGHGCMVKIISGEKPPDFRAIPLKCENDTNQQRKVTGLI